MMYASQGSHSSAPSDGSSTSYMSENSDHSSSHSMEMYKILKDKRSTSNNHLKQNGSHPNKKRGHSLKSHSTHNSSSNHHDDHEIEDRHSKSINASNQHYKTSMNSYRTSSDASLSNHNQEHDNAHSSSRHSSNSHHKSRKSNQSHPLKQSRTSNTTSHHDEHHSNKRKQYSSKKEQKNEKNKLKASKLDEFSKQNRKYLCLNDDDARSMMSEQSIEFLGHVEDNQISIKAIPKKVYKNNKIKQEYIDENRSDSGEEDYEYWKPQDINTNTVSQLKKGTSHSTTSSSPSASSSHSQRSITELTLSTNNPENNKENNNNDKMNLRLKIIQSDNAQNTENNKKKNDKPQLKNNTSGTTDQSYVSSEMDTVESSILSPLSDQLSQIYGNTHQPKTRYNGQYIYNHHQKNHLLSQPMDRVQIRSHQIQKKPRHHHHGHKQSHDDGDTISVVSTQSIETAASLNSISTSATSNKYRNDMYDKQDYERVQLRQKIQEQIALQKEYDKTRHMHEDTMETESYLSAVYTDETRSVYTEDQHQRHKSMDTVTTKDYEPSIFTDIDYDIDYNNVGIKDIVWTQKLKYLKNRLIFLEKEIADLPTTSKQLDKLMLYIALEFLSINPDEKKANDRLVEWWDLHKYSWLDKHDPQKEDTLLSQNWNEIGIPLTRDPGSTPTHHNKTLFEDIYDNLKRTEWIDPISLFDDDDKNINDDNKSVMIPSTILFNKDKYKDYDKREVHSYLIDGTDFLNFLHRQTTGNLVRSKSGLVGYVNVSVEDKIAECTPWKIHRIFQTSAWNRLNHANNRKLLAKNDALNRSTETKSDQIEAYRIEITQLKEKVQQQQAIQSQMREEYEMQLDAIIKKPSSTKSSKRGNSAKRHKHNKQYLGGHHGYRGISDNSQDSHEISPSPSGHSQLMSFDPSQQYSRSVPPHDDNEAYLHSQSPPPHYNANDHHYHPQYYHPQYEYETPQRFSPMMQSKSHHSSSTHSHHKRHYTQPQHLLTNKKKRKNNNKNIVIYTGNDPHHHNHYQKNTYDDTYSTEESNNSSYEDYYNHNDYYDHQENHYHSKRSKRQKSSPTKAKSKVKTKVKVKVKTKTKTKSSKSKSKLMESKPSPIPQQMTLNSKQRRDMAINRSKRALATWKLYVDRYEYIKKRYPTQIADRNKAWLQWTKMLDERDKNPNKALTESELWSYIDFARMSISRYANWIWWPERPDLIQLNPLKLKTINKAKKKSNSSIKDDNRTYINDKQYYDHQLNLIFTKKFAIVMDFNLFLFETYANPANIQETLAYEHSLLSLASSTNVVVSKKNSKDFYLNTSGKNEYRYLQFRCDGKNDDDDDAQRNEWMEELDYQIHIVHDLLSIPNIKLKIADPNATVWLPTPCVTNKKISKSKPSTPSTQKTGQV